MNNAVPIKALPSIAELTGSKQIRLILSDFDGTFTNRSNEVVKKNVEAFCLAQKLGIHIGFATGRGRESTVYGLWENAATMNYNGYPGVFCNGSIVVGPGGEKVMEATIPASVQPRLLDALKQRGLLTYVMGLTEDASYCLDYNDWTLVCYNRFSEQKPLLLPDEESFYKRPFNKLMVWHKHEELVVLRKELEHEMGDVIDFTMPYSDLLELSGKGNTKGRGLLALANHLGLTPDEVLVVGDSENDISMFKAAGVAVAVGDARPEAKNAAMYQAVPSYDGPLLEIVQTLEEKGLCPNKADETFS